jgi:opacity protein-like surface antigen
LVEKAEIIKKEEGERKMEKFKIVLVLAVLVLVSVCQPAQGQGQTTDADKWQLEFTSYFWFPDADFTGTMSGMSSDIKVDFKDVFDSIDDLDILAFSGRLEAWKGDWGLFLDGQYVDIKYDDSFTSPIGGVKFNMAVEDNILDFGASYMLYKVPLEDNGNRMFTFAPLGGVRYHYLKQEAKLNSVQIGGDEEWVEPFVGVLLKYDLAENLAAGARADYGGFGIGSASDHTWNLWAGFDWKFKESMSLKLGYRIYDIEYSRHSGNKEFGMDGQLKGPTIGLTIAF